MDWAIGKLKLGTLGLKMKPNTIFLHNNLIFEAQWAFRFFDNISDVTLIPIVIDPAQYLITYMPYLYYEIIIPQLKLHLLL